MSEAIPEDIREKVKGIFLTYDDGAVILGALCALVLSERNATLERAAKIAEAHKHSQWRDPDVAESVKEEIATAIRALSKAGTD